MSYDGNKQKEADYKRSQYWWYKSHHICVDCKQQTAAPNRVRCSECLAKMAEYKAKYDRLHHDKIMESNRKWRAKAAENGRCTRCGRKLLDLSHRKCVSCREKDRLRQQRRRELQQIAAGRKKHTDGMCIRCNNPALPGRKLCQHHYDMACKALEKARINSPLKQYIANEALIRNAKRAH